MAEDTKRAYELGAHAYIIKPVELHELDRLLKSTFEFWSFCQQPHALAMTH